MNCCVSYSIFFLSFLSLLNIVQSFYLPNSYQRYMDENQAILRNLLTEVEHSSENEQPFHKEASEETKASAPSHPDAKASSANLLPRRDQRQFFFAPQYKRMRPCFYSPIQCLMKRSEVLGS